MAQQVRILLHSENSGKASRSDLAILTDGVITDVFTLKVSHEGIVGSLNQPFLVGATYSETMKALADLNSFPDGAVCLCGSVQDHHIKTAACVDYSVIEEIDVLKAMEIARKMENIEVQDELEAALVEIYMLAA